MNFPKERPTPAVSDGAAAGGGASVVGAELGAGVIDDVEFDGT
jgi:hypothetical protein